MKTRGTKLGRSGVKKDKSALIANNEKFDQKLAKSSKQIKKSRFVGQAPKKVELNLKKVAKSSVKLYQRCEGPR